MRMIEKILLRGLIFILLFSNCQRERDARLMIATAANMQFAMKELTRSFTQETGIACEAIISSSGKLTAQIREGAPFDIFVSADMKYPMDLQKQGFAAEAPKVYAYGKLVLWTMQDDLECTLASLAKKEVRHIAMANPKIAPYGIAAEQVLQHADLLEDIRSKIVYGESIAQTNQFINSGAVTIGFTSKSAVLSPILAGKGQWIDLDPKAYTPIKQGIVLLKDRENHLDQARMFYNFLFSVKGKEILNKFGYTESKE